MVSDTLSCSRVDGSRAQMGSLYAADTHAATELLPALLWGGGHRVGSCGISGSPALFHLPSKAILFPLIIPKVCLKYAPPSFLLLTSFWPYSWLLKLPYKHF